MSRIFKFVTICRGRFCLGTFSCLSLIFINEIFFSPHRIYQAILCGTKYSQWVFFEIIQLNIAVNFSPKNCLRAKFSSREIPAIASHLSSFWWRRDKWLAGPCFLQTLTQSSLLGCNKIFLFITLEQMVLNLINYIRLQLVNYTHITFFFIFTQTVLLLIDSCI